jgi:hypothetical protein
MEPQPCGDPLFHRGCPHPGWKKSSYDEVVAVNAARDAATYASKDLSLDLISIQFFEPGPLVLLGPDSDKALVQLNGGWFDPHMIGKACHPETTPLPTVWVRIGLSPCLTAAVVLHEARHVWHSQRGTDIQLAMRWSAKYPTRTSAAFSHSVRNRTDEGVHSGKCWHSCFQPSVQRY